MNSLIKNSLMASRFWYYMLYIKEMQIVNIFHTLWFMFDVDWKVLPPSIIPCCFCFCLLQNIGDIRNGRGTKIPVFNLETGSRSSFKELEVSEDCGVVC